MRDVFEQYAALIELRTTAVRTLAPAVKPDMRTGWMIWEDSLTEFLYFEEPMFVPNADDYKAEWNVTPAKGARKESKSLWIYDKKTDKKRYSVTTSAGIKIQPYFDVPGPSDSNLCYFRVQSEPIDADTVRLWVGASTANALKNVLGSLECSVVSAAIASAIEKEATTSERPELEDGLAVPIDITSAAHAQMLAAWEAVSDEHRAQLLLKALA
jgi:hypothetical protein